MSRERDIAVAQAQYLALIQAEETLQRVQRYVGLLRQHDPELSMLVARAREKANAALVLGDKDPPHK